MLAFGEEARYRLRLADGFLKEAGEDISLRRWRSCVDNSQLAAENAAKAVLALLGPVGRTHLPASLLRRALSENRFPEPVTQLVERLAECAELLGPEIHAGTDYGDESMWRTVGKSSERMTLSKHFLSPQKQLLWLMKFFG
jgi:HEPN domain-containing protein